MGGGDGGTGGIWESRGLSKHNTKKKGGGGGAPREKVLRSVARAEEERQGEAWRHKRGVLRKDTSGEEETLTSTGTSKHRRAFPGECQRKRKP